MKLFDAHCHLQSTAAFDRAAATGVEKIVCCGTSSTDWNAVLLASHQQKLIPMIGSHPWFVSDDWESTTQLLENLLLAHPGAGVGETGLDFQERFTNRLVQEASFASHLDLARELHRPVAVHCVQAWGRLIEILREHPAPRILLHAFGGTPELIPELIELNCWFSFCGSVTNPNAKRVRASAAAVPENRLLIETDSPDFPPAGFESPNEPANLIHVSRAIAELRGISIERLAKLTYTNADHFFHTLR